MTGSTTLDGTLTSGTPATRYPADRLPTALLILLFTTAALLGLTPFLTVYTETRDYEGIDGVDVDAQVDRINGWGQVGDGGSVMGPHDVRLGVVLVLAAVVLVLAGCATAIARRSTWPANLAVLGGGMAVAARAFQALQTKQILDTEHSDGEGVSLDVSVGTGLWLTLATAALAAVVTVLSWRHAQLLRRRTPPAYPSAGGTVDDRPPYALLALWLAMAAVLALAPLLTSLTMRSSSDGDSYEFTIDGWGRLGGDAAGHGGHGLRFGVLCVVVAAVLVVALAAALLQRSAAWPIRLGLLATGMAVATGVIQLLQVDSDLSYEREGVDYSVGVGAWLLSGVAGLAVAATVVAVARLHRIRA